MSNTALWTAVTNRYDSQGLIELTNIRDPSATTVGTTKGQIAAQTVINLWGIYAQEDYDASDNAHIEVAVIGVIAVLWRWGGTSTTIEEVKWEEVFGDDGMISKVKRTNARAHGGPSSNSGVTQAAESTSTGRNYRPWADPESLPGGRSFLPTRRSVNDW